MRTIASPNTQTHWPPPPAASEAAQPAVASDLPESALRALFAKFDLPWEGESSRSALLRALFCLETIEDLKHRAQGPRVPPPPPANA